MTRLAFAAFALAWVSVVLAQGDGTDLPPIGTVVSGSFNVGGRSIPLPEGKFVLMAKAVGEPGLLEGDISKTRPKVLRVFLAQIEQQKLRAAVWASVALKPTSFRFTWVSQPCRKEDTLFRANLASGDGENCLLVDHMLGTFSSRSQGIWKEAAAWLAEQQVQLPVPVFIVANVTRMEEWQLLTASYAFNPRIYGCDAPRSRSWAESPWNKKSIDGDAQRVRFVESVTAWGKGVQHYFNELVAGRQPSVEKAASIYGCASAQAALGSRQVP
jgi:hypothetical protein